MSCFGNPLPWCLPSAPWLFTLAGYWSPEVYPWSPNLTIVNTKQVGYPWYKSMFLFQGLTRISSSYYFLTTVWRSSKMGVLYLYLHPRYLLSASSYKSCKNLSTSPSANNVRVQSSIEWLSFYTLPRLTRSRIIWSEWQPAHLNPKGLWKYYIITCEATNSQGFL